MNYFQGINPQVCVEESKCTDAEGQECCMMINPDDDDDNDDGYFEV